MGIARWISEAVSGDMIDDAPQKHMRWAPTLPLLIVLAGFVLHVRGDSDWGELTCFAAFFLSMIIARFGPLRQPRRDDPLDERENLWRNRALLAGASTVALLAILGAFVAAGGERLGIWRPATNEDWRIIFMVLTTVLINIPILHASWTTRPIGEEA